MTDFWAKQTLEQAIADPKIRDALLDLVGCRIGSDWPETAEGEQRLSEVLPCLDDRAYTRTDLIARALCADHDGRYAWRQPGGARRR